MKIFRLECPDRIILIDYNNNALPQDVIIAINKHIKNCKFCKDDISSIQKKQKENSISSNQNFKLFQNVLKKVNLNIKTASENSSSQINTIDFQKEAQKYKKIGFGDIYSTKNIIEVNKNKYYSVNTKYVLIISDIKNIGASEFVDIAIANDLNYKRIYEKFAGADDIIINIKDYPQKFIIHTWNVWTISTNCLKKYLTSLSKTAREIVKNILDDKKISKSNINKLKKEYISFGTYKDFNDIEYLAFKEEEMETVKYLIESSEILYNIALNQIEKPQDKEQYLLVASDEPDFNNYIELKKLFNAGRYVGLGKKLVEKYKDSAQPEKKELKKLYKELLNYLKKKNEYKYEYDKIKTEYKLN